MKSILKALLSESSEVSTVRVMAIWSILAGTAIAVWGVYRGNDLSGLAQVVAVFVTSAFAAKTISKYAEKKDQ